LCPPAVAQLPGLASERGATAMRAAGVCTPADEPMVTGWLSSCARPMPDWLSELVAQTAAEAAERQACAQAEALEAEHRRLLVEERVQEKLLRRRRSVGRAAAPGQRRCCASPRITMMASLRLTRIGV
jgi:hypothetical protein